MKGAKRRSPRAVAADPSVYCSFPVDWLGKQKLYLTQDEALAHALALPAGSLPGLHAYLCPDCGAGWHLGHERRKR